MCGRGCESLCAGVSGRRKGGGTSPNENYVPETHGTSSNAKSRRRHAKQCNSDHMTFSFVFPNNNNKKKRYNHFFFLFIPLDATYKGGGARSPATAKGVA